MTKGFQIKRSAIHGRGLFAVRPFAPGELIGVFEGEVCSRNGHYVLWVEQEDGSELGIKCTNDLRFVNHSTSPNCEFDGDQLAAIKPIQPGDELTCNYGDDWA